MAEDWIKPVRISLGVANIIFILVGSTLIGLGVWIFLDAEDYFDVFDKGSLYGVSIVSIVTGSLVVMASFFGCCGAFVRSRLLLIIYIGTLLFILMAQIILIVLALQFKDKVDANVREELIPAVMNKYGLQNQNDVTIALDSMQRNLECCGANGPNDWSGATAWKASNTNVLFPKSCCKDAGINNCNTNIANAFTKGCITELKSWAEEKFLIFSSVSIAMLFFQIFGILIGVALLRMTPSNNEDKRTEVDNY